MLGSAVAADAGWVTWTSFADVRHIRLIDDTVYMATSGGLLAVTDTASPGVRYTNIDGLGTGDITDIIKAADGQKWVTSYGRLIKFDGAASVRYPFEDNQGDLFGLYCVADDGDNLWVGTELGLILFSKVNDGGQIQDYYQFFGNLTVVSNVYDVELVDDTIWLATSAGLARGNRAFPDSLKAPNSWKMYSADEYPELDTDTMYSVVQFESEIYIATARSMYRLDRLHDTFIQVPFAVGLGFYGLEIEHDSLFAYSKGGVARIKDGLLTPLATVGLPSQAKSGVRRGAVRWMGVRTGGIYHDAGNGRFTEYPYVGLPEIAVTDVTITQDGLLTVLLSQKGPCEYDNAGGQWNRREVDVGARTLVMCTDDYGWNWVGTFGGGLSRVGDTVAQYTNLNSTLQGEPADSNSVICFDVATEGHLLFATSWQAWAGSPVAIADLRRLDEPDGWISLGRDDGINDTDIVAVDYSNRCLALGSSNAGVFCCYLKADPFDGVDSVVNYSEDHGYLIADVVRVVRFAPDGELWVGTNRGLCHFEDDYGFFVDVNLPRNFGPEITALEFDGRGNVWIGSINGLVRAGAVTGEFTHYTTRNSGLIDDKINSLTFDQYSGDLYISTPSGLSMMSSTIGRPTTDVDSVYAFPNPYVVRSSDDVLSFNFDAPATLRIFTVAGELVAERPEAEWDGRNQHGEQAASGVYLFVLTDANGQVGRGKILLVRK